MQKTLADFEAEIDADAKADGKKWNAEKFKEKAAKEPKLELPEEWQFEDQEEEDE